MSLLIKIAGIPILIRGKDFLKALSENENRLLDPFVYKHKTALRQPYIADVKLMDKKAISAGCKIDPALIAGIKSFFVSGNDCRFRRAFGYFVRNNLHYCLRDERSSRMLKGILKSKADYSRIIINSDLFLLFDQTGRHLHVYLRQPQFSKNTIGLKDKWAYNLNILRPLLRMILSVGGDGVILHASCAVDKGSGYVFVGYGGAGKSTTVDMLAPQRILSDDTAIIRKINNRYQMHSNPLWNTDKYITPQAVHLPVRLKAIFFIEKASRTSVKKLDYKKSLAMLIYRDIVFQQTGFIDGKAGIKRFYLFSQQLARDIPAFLLKIKKGAGFKKDFRRLVKSYL